jgi:hypothetical protein
MLEPKKVDPLTEGVISPQMRPKCPQCQTDPIPIAANLISLEGAMAVVFFCGVCRNVLSVSALSDATTKAARPPSMLVRPS